VSLIAPLVTLVGGGLSLVGGGIAMYIVWRDERRITPKRPDAPEEVMPRVRDEDPE
jgi:hypothetical protein